MNNQHPNSFDSVENCAKVITVGVMLPFCFSSPSNIISWSNSELLQKKIVKNSKATRMLPKLLTILVTSRFFSMISKFTVSQEPIDLCMWILISLLIDHLRNTLSDTIPLICACAFLPMISKFTVSQDPIDLCMWILISLSINHLRHTLSDTIPLICACAFLSLKSFFQNAKH